MNNGIISNQTVPMHSSKRKRFTKNTVFRANEDVFQRVLIENISFSSLNFNLNCAKHLNVKNK